MVDTFADARLNDVQNLAEEMEDEVAQELTRDECHVGSPGSFLMGPNFRGDETNKQQKKTNVHVFSAICHLYIYNITLFGLVSYNDPC